MELAAPRPLTELIGGDEDAHGVVAHPRGRPVHEVQQDRTRVLLIGPEGGFSRDEEQTFETAGWPRVRLGQYVLRAETAAVVGVALLSART